MCSCRASSEAALPRVLQSVLSTMQPPHTRPSSTMPRPQMSPTAQLAQKREITYSHRLQRKDRCRVSTCCTLASRKLHSMPAQLPDFSHVFVPECTLETNICFFEGCTSTRCNNGRHQRVCKW
jgi:hypothetical protein